MDKIQLLSECVEAQEKVRRFCVSFEVNCVDEDARCEKCYEKFFELLIEHPKCVSALRLNLNKIQRFKKESIIKDVARELADDANNLFEFTGAKGLKDIDKWEGFFTDLVNNPSLLEILRDGLKKIEITVFGEPLSQREKI